MIIISVDDHSGHDNDDDDRDEATTRRCVTGRPTRALQTERANEGEREQVRKSM